MQTEIQPATLLWTTSKNHKKQIEVQKQQASKTMTKSCSLNKPLWVSINWLGHSM